MLRLLLVHVSSILPVVNVDDGRCWPVVNDKICICIDIRTYMYIIKLLQLLIWDIFLCNTMRNFSFETFLCVDIFMFVIDGCLYSQFTAQGLMITARNYLDVYPYDRWNAKVTIKRVGELWNISVYILNHFFLPLFHGFFCRLSRYIKKETVSSQILLMWVLVEAYHVIFLI